MVVFEVRGVQVDFPFEPYQCQKVYMEKVITCLQERRHGLLESPTGTGKTLCLLCATLAWRNHVVTQQRSMAVSQANSMKNDLGFYGGSGPAPSSASNNTWTKNEELEVLAPKIIYASRTHSQLSQVVSELKNSVYRPKVCILGSRDQLCVHPAIVRAETLTEKVHMCRAKVSARSCIYHNNLEEKKKDPTLTETIMDIEDLVTFGAQQRVCPYYLARELRATADIIFMPYNYILDGKTRQAFGIDLNNTIVILDEAHNVEKMCEESSSFDLTSTDIGSCISNVTRCIEYVSRMKEGMPVDAALLPSNEEPGDDDEKDYIALKHILLNVEAELDKLEVPPDGVTKKGEFIFEFFQSCGVTSVSKGPLLEMCDKALSVLTTQAAFMGKSFALQKFADAVKIVFGNAPVEDVAGNMQQPSVNTRDLSHFYKVHIMNDKKSGKPKTGLWTSGSGSQQGRVLSYWCFSPGRAMSELVRHGIHSLILTSGTLSPLDTFSSEMHVPFDVQLQNPHVIHGEQIFVGVLTTGPAGQGLRSSFDRRSVPEYKSDLGNALVNIARVVPNGLLVFFPSYPVMAECVEHWKNNFNIWDRINKLKPAFTEPKNKADFNMTIDGFYEKIRDPEYHSAAFFAVCRGKVSEGLDFADYNGRAVVITGLPFPPRFDAKVRLKMDYMEECCRKHRKGDPNPLTGEKWYRQQASRAVNQAIGRVIRHRLDFGAILLCDERFSNTDVKEQLPSWVKPHVRVYKAFHALARELPAFFNGAEKLVGAPPLPSEGSRKSHSATTEISAKTILARPHGGNKTRVPVIRSNEREVFTPSLAGPGKRSHLNIEYDKFDERSGSSSSALSSLSTSETVLQDTAAGKVPINVYESDAKIKKTSSFSDQILQRTSSTNSKTGRPTLKVVRPRSTQSEVTAAEPVNSTSASVDRQPKASTTSTTSATTNGHADSDASEADKQKLKQKLAHDYLVKVRQVLSPDPGAYTALLAGLQRYKKEKNLSTLWKLLSATFTTPDNYTLLTEFSTFLRSEHISEYEKLCEGFHSQRQSVGSGKSSAKSASSSRSTAGASSGTAGDRSTAYTSSKKNSKSGDPASKAKPSTSSSSIAAGGDTPKSATLSFEANSKGDPVGVIHLADDPARQKIAKQTHLPSGRVCFKCKQKPGLFEASCTHVCCLPCWKAHLKVERVCPQCQAAVRPKNLRKVYFC